MRMLRPRQRCSAAWLGGAALLLLLLTLGALGSGCRSIYGKSAEIYPPDPRARLKLRVDEAHQAQEQARQAAVRVSDQLVKGVARESLEPHLDRLEAAAGELDRRVAAANDSLAGCDTSNQLAAEIQALQTRAADLLETVQALRSNDSASTLQRLDRCLDSLARH